MLAAQELHRDVRLAAGQPAVVEDLDDAGVADRARGPRLLEEPIDEDRILGELRQEDLHGRGAAQHDVLGAVRGAHAAFAELIEEPILADDAAGHVSLAYHRAGGPASRIAAPA